MITLSFAFNKNIAHGLWTMLGSVKNNKHGYMLTMSFSLDEESS